MEADDVDKLGRRFFVKRIRRVVPKPSELAHRVESVFRVFNGKSTPKHGMLFKGGMDEVHSKVMDIVLGGFASDFMADMYHEHSFDQHGMRQYACSRSSSPLEGFHFHLRSSIPGATNLAQTNAHLLLLWLCWCCCCGLFVVVVTHLLLLLLLSLPLLLLLLF